MTPEELTGYNQKDLRMLNRMSVFRMIFENRTISRAEIARQTGLNPATVTNIAKELMRQGWVEETGPERVEVSLGRPRSGLRIKADAGYIVSISVERYRVEIAITDLCFHRMVYREFRAGAGGAHSSYSEYLTVQQALDVLDETIAGSGVPVEQILGIGVAAPGPVDVTAGALLNVPNFPGWSGLPLRQLLSRRLPVPVHITRDANACALAEKWFGVARDLDQYLCVVAATGIGGSLVLNGDIFGGANFLAGEFGHVTINPDGERCDCGNVGCLELYASPQAMARRATEAIEAGEASLLSRTATIP